MPIEIILFFAASAMSFRLPPVNKQAKMLDDLKPFFRGVLPPANQKALPQHRHAIVQNEYAVEFNLRQSITSNFRQPIKRKVRVCCSSEIGFDNAL